MHTRPDLLRMEIEAARGKTVSHLNCIPFKLVTQKNLAQFLKAP